MLLLSIAASVIILATAGALWRSHQISTSTPKKAAAPDQLSTASALSISVLPFANQTGDPQKGFIADALTISITSDLGRIRDIGGFRLCEILRGRLTAVSGRGRPSRGQARSPSIQLTGAMRRRKRDEKSAWVLYPGP